MKFIVIFVFLLSSFAQEHNPIQDIAENYKSPLGKILNSSDNSNYGYLSTIVNMRLRRKPPPLPLVHKKVYLDVNKLQEGPLKQKLKENLKASKVPFYITDHPQKKRHSSDLMVNIPGTYSESNSNSARHVAFANAQEGKVVITFPNPISEEYYDLKPNFDFGDIEKYSETNNALVSSIITELNDKDGLKVSPISHLKLKPFKNVQLTGFSLGTFIATEMAHRAPSGTYQSVYLLSPPKDLLQSIRNLDLEKEIFEKYQNDSEINLKNDLRNFLYIRGTNFDHLARTANNKNLLRRFQDYHQTLSSINNQVKNKPACPIDHKTQHTDRLEKLQKRARHLFVFTGFEKKRRKLLNHVHQTYEDIHQLDNSTKKSKAHNFDSMIDNYAPNFKSYLEKEIYVSRLSKKLPRSSLAYQISQLKNIDVAVLTSKNDPINANVNLYPESIQLNISDLPIMPIVAEQLGNHYFEIANGEGHNLAEIPYHVFTENIDQTFRK